MDIKEQFPPVVRGAIKSPRSLKAPNYKTKNYTGLGYGVGTVTTVYEFTVQDFMFWSEILH